MYAKVFRSLWTGTLYGRSDPQHVFIYLLCHADREGFVDVSPPAIAGATGLPLDRVQAALVELEAPDPNSRSGEQDGRRLERIDAHRPWGWRVVNFLPYRNLKDADMVREQTRERVKKHRETRGNAPVTRSNARKRHAEVEVDAEVDAKTEEEHSCSPSGERPANGAANGTAHPDTNGNGALSLEQWFATVFWPNYPRAGVSNTRPGKRKAWIAIRALFRKHPKPDHDDLGDRIMRRVLALSAEGRESQFVPHAVKFIHDEDWTDA